MASKGSQMELLFKALADRTRLRLLNLMGEDEVCVCYFVEVLGTNQPKISRHLAYLRRAGVVTARRDGKWMHYRVVAPRTRTRRASSRRCARGSARSARCSRIGRGSRASAARRRCPSACRARRAPPASPPEDCHPASLAS